MRNMILTVGPTTPASYCWRDYTTSVGDSDNNDDSDDHSTRHEDSSESSDDNESTNMGQSMMAGHSILSRNQHLSSTLNFEVRLSSSSPGQENVTIRNNNNSNDNVDDGSDRMTAMDENDNHNMMQQIVQQTIDFLATTGNNYRLVDVSVGNLDEGEIQREEVSRAGNRSNTASELVSQGTQGRIDNTIIESNIVQPQPTRQNNNSVDETENVASSGGDGESDDDHVSDVNEDEHRDDRMEDASDDDSDDNGDNSDDDSNDDGPSLRSVAGRVNSLETKKAWLPSIRHGGCINTACWLTCPWRLSTAEKTSMSSSSTSTTTTPNFLYSEECPTQLITSGDDKLIKFWDVRNAMGMSSPLPGGFDTFCPLADYATPPSKSVVKNWRRNYRRRLRCDRDDEDSENHTHKSHIPVAYGGVNELASIHTGHRGNVFHVTPINEKPGQIVSCGADGFLRLVNLEKAESAVVVNPNVTNEESDEMMPFFLNSVMAFSHILLTANTGLLCSERGLHQFDLRLSGRQQQTHSLFQSPTNVNQSNGRSRNRSIACKTCAIWSPYGVDSADPNYIFAGGANATVELFDLRMISSNNNERKVLQRYRPRMLDGKPGNVSVSGLDVSKDGKELLVSYEIDQIYTFPIFPNVASRAGPTLDEIDATCEASTNNPDLFVPELAAYGGHLNRFTFLKNPKYAGPNDEYICTGSDSGNAWIYEKKTGTVVSLLGADSSTCNGIIPHPVLPFFITYGIESTAKIWRAAPPVDPTVDNSYTGKRHALLNKTQHELSPVTRSWDGVQLLLKRFEKNEPTVMPDFVASSEEIATCARFASRSLRSLCGSDSPRIGNSLRNLPTVLRQNRFECYRSFHDEMEDRGPIEQPLKDFNHRVAIQRLKLQADSLGAQWNSLYPWVFTIQKYEGSTPLYHVADLIPDSPSDWILFDKTMTKEPINPILNINSVDYPDLLQEEPSGIGHETFTDEVRDVDTTPWLGEDQRIIDSDDESSGPPLDEEVSCNGLDEFAMLSRKLLLETVIVLKDAGNVAMKANNFHAAAKYYDKAIQYCAVALMHYQEGNNTLQHLSVGHHAVIGVPSTSVIALWSPLLRLLITTRLNMALLLLKPDFAVPARSADQARHALKLLAPFTRQEGYVACVLRRTQHVISNKEPKETYHEARALQAKAYFRLGSAELEMADYAAAVKSFEQSVKCSDSKSSNQKPDSLLLRRLHEAKRMHGNKKKRDRRRYQRLVARDDD
jgi:hypothetical protein